MLSELFLITAQSNTFPLSIDKMEAHIFRAYARAELLILGTGDVSGQITLCCRGLSCDVDVHPWFIPLDTSNSLPQL